MKVLVLSVVALFTTQVQAKAGAPVRDCDIANQVACVVPLQKSAMQVTVHNSGRNYCGLRLLSNKNFIAGESAREFAEGLEADLNAGREGSTLAVRANGNAIEITDTSRSEEGTLPIWFIVPIELRTKSGEAIGTLAERTLGSRELEGSPVTLTVQATLCKKGRELE